MPSRPAATSAAAAWYGLADASGSRHSKRPGSVRTSAVRLFGPWAMVAGAHVVPVMESRAASRL